MTELLLGLLTLLFLGMLTVICLFLFSHAWICAVTFCLFSVAYLWAWRQLATVMHNRDLKEKTR